MYWQNSLQTNTPRLNSFNCWLALIVYLTLLSSVITKRVQFCELISAHFELMVLTAPPLSARDLAHLRLRHVHTSPKAAFQPKTPRLGGTALENCRTK